MEARYEKDRRPFRACAAGSRTSFSSKPFAWPIPIDRLSGTLHQHGQFEHLAESRRPPEIIPVLDLGMRERVDEAVGRTGNFDRETRAAHASGIAKCVRRRKQRLRVAGEHLPMRFAPRSEGAPCRRCRASAPNRRGPTRPSPCRTRCSDRDAEFARCNATQRGRRLPSETGAREPKNRPTTMPRRPDRTCPTAGRLRHRVRRRMRAGPWNASARESRRCRPMPDPGAMP